LGEQLLTLARQVPDASLLSRAHMMQGEVLYHLGEFARAREHSEQGIAVYDPVQCWSHLFAY
jgi:hypothetical protein